MIVENMTREEMIEFIKAHCAKVIKDIPNTNFKAGQYYQFMIDWEGASLIGNKGEWFNLYELDNIDEYLEERK